MSRWNCVKIALISVSILIIINWGVVIVFTIVLGNGWDLGVHDMSRIAALVLGTWLIGLHLLLILGSAVEQHCALTAYALLAPVTVITLLVVAVMAGVAQSHEEFHSVMMR